MTEKDEGFDPHASEIDPNDPRLKLQRPRGRVLKKGPVVAIAAALGGILLLAITIALKPPAVEKKGTSDAKELQASVIQKQISVPDVISNAPDNSDSLPVTGEVEKDISTLREPPLEGIGQTMIEPAVQTFSGYEASKKLLAVNDSVSKEEERAVVSAVFFTGVASDDEPSVRQAGKTTDDTIDKIISAAYRQADGAYSESTVSNDQNMQAHKTEFVLGDGSRDNNYLGNSVSEPMSPYEVKAGTVIPVSLITGINSDLPGQVVGQVRENVYDTVTGNFLLIPQGSRLLAAYDSAISYGQDRVLICWNRLIRPDGSSIDLECAPGVDLSGYAGFEDDVDNHWLRLMGGIVFSSVLSATATTSQGSTYDTEDVSFGQTVAANVGQNINDVGQQITRKNLNVQPTIKIRPGYSVNVLVNKDMVLPPYEAWE